ncbi:HesB/IscA family protein [Aureibacter tunicatorum]|uniref:Iron-sulfur cluster assembly protein n=1 Tax=Aureibacter tunicatorum TaxID=866807 RepID=A0AAE4BSD0_9BACT|nr:iron-sulfur cluster assembly accessory protein [Aureibacter tunicatorum]MDR6238723.1 iron-sulfur cluster assembly protein [Aureibacter tunicatorum]BDD05346.1 hypothetical protein AUTU_28290 [Aureibacter tunicatorum]
MFVPIKISEVAIREIKQLLQSKKVPEGYGLRVGVKGGGCSGMSFMLGFDKEKEGDDSFTVEGISVFVEKRHAMYLIGKEIDFHESNEARGFYFKDEKTGEEVK